MIGDPKRGYMEQKGSCFISRNPKPYIASQVSAFRLRPAVDEVFVLPPDCAPATETGWLPGDRV